jgi:hypothetical protein
MRRNDLFDSNDDVPTIPMRRGPRGVIIAPDYYPPTVIVAPEPPSEPPPPVEIEIHVTHEPEPTFLVDRGPRSARIGRMLWFAFGALFVLSASSPWVAESVHEAVSVQPAPPHAAAGAPTPKPPCVLTAALSDAYNSAFSSK